MAISTKIFKAYDIRGIYPDEINEEAAEKIGAAFARFLKKPPAIAVGRDARQSSPALFERLVKGTTSQGIDVLDIGICTTPMLNFAVIKNELKGGIMISASHNPAQYNAFKLIGNKGVQFSENKIGEIRDLVLGENFEVGLPLGNLVPEVDILDKYTRHILNFAENIKGLKIVVDYGNGVGSISAKPVFEKMDIEVVPIFEKPDGRFPNHPADPHHIENMNELRKRLQTEEANLGIFFDGDADRAIMIDEKGAIVFSDLLTALLAQEELKKHPGEKAYYDLRFSKVVKEIIEKSGGEPVMMRVGNPFYKEKLINEGGILAGELSGHIMFKENYGIDDGLFAAIKTMDIICLSGKKLSELIRPFQKYFATEEINIKLADADETMRKVAEHFKDGRSIDLDGVYIEYPDWWFNLRKSNTEPLVRLRIEANTKELIEEKRDELLKLIG